jgi:Icc-related predicted phosphoesterase
MLISVVSDTHSLFPNLPESDIVISCGDILPDHQFQTKEKIKLAKKQLEWVKDHLDQYKKWIGNRPFFSLFGNHEYVSSNLFISLLKSAGIKGYDLTDKLFKYKQITFYGFGAIPFIDGSFNREFLDSDMTNEILKLKKILTENKVDILMTHCPPFGFADQENIYCEHFGISQLTNLLYYDQDIHLPKAILSGHIHSPLDSRIQTITINNQDILFSNAATTVNMLNLDF